MKKSYEELQDEALIGEGGNICDISIDRLRSPTMKKLHKSQCHDPKAGKERDSGMQRAAKKAGMSRANRMKLYNDVNEGESRMDALKRAMAIAKWKKEGGKVDKLPPGRASGIYRGKGVKRFDDEEDNEINRAIMAYRKSKRKKKKNEDVGEGYQEISNLVDITKRVMDQLINAMKKEDFKAVSSFYKQLGKIIK
jgi:hypothetical protein